MSDMEQIISEVITTHEDVVGTHYEGCWRCHVGCLAVLLRDMGAPEPRVPVQGEPNDDRETLSTAIGSVLFNVMNFPQAAQSRLLGQDMRPLRYMLEDAVLEAGFSRAVVPDAATAALERVRALHFAVDGIHCHKVCAHRYCVDDSGDQCRWPCPTIAALDGEGKS